MELPSYLLVLVRRMANRHLSDGVNAQSARLARSAAMHSITLVGEPNREKLAMSNHSIAHVGEPSREKLSISMQCLLSNLVAIVVS